MTSVAQTAMEQIALPSILKVGSRTAQESPMQVHRATIEDFHIGPRIRDIASASSESLISMVIAVSFLPWIAVALFAAAGWAALNLIAYAILIFAAGYSIVAAVCPRSARTETFFFVPCTGILAISALSAFWLRLGLSLVWVPALWLGLAAAGLLALWRDRTIWAKSTVACGKSLVIFSLLICAVYFVPSAKNDLVQLHDGSFRWSDWQTQHFHAIAASIKNSEGPPRSPGTDTAQLLYHFGPLAPAAAISRFDSLNLGDAMVRVTRAVSLWALVLSCFGLGTVLSLKASNSRFGGIMSVVGLFFCGSLASNFNDLMTRHHRIQTLLFQSNDSRMLVDAGPFGHFLMGHSLVHGLGAITVIMGLCLIAREKEPSLTWDVAILLLLPALAVPTNSLAALYCFGTVSILLFWGRLGQLRSWVPILLMCCLFLAAWKLMGYSHAPDSQAVIKDHLASQWWPLVLWFVTGLGFRIIAFRWIVRPFKDPISAVVLFSLVALLAFSLAFHFRDNNELYGIYFLQSMLSIFAFSRLTPESWQGAPRSRLISDWLRISIKGVAVLCACGSLIVIVALSTHHQTGILLFRDKLLLAFLLLATLIAISSRMRRNSHFASVGSAVLMMCLLVGVFAWITTWFRYTAEGSRTDIVYSRGVVQGLHRLGKLMPPGDRFATNKHSLRGDTLQWPSEHSYGYSALSERPVLLEGYLARGEKSLPWFNAMLRDNDSLFTTNDPQKVRAIARTWQVQWLVAAPGTDIALPRPLPGWLIEQQNCGDLKIYHVE